MATSTATQYKHLEPRPGSHYRQLFLKGRRIRAAVVHEAVHGPDPDTPEEFARNFGVPLDAVREALDYVANNLPRHPDRLGTRSNCGASRCPSPERPTAS